MTPSRFPDFAADLESAAWIAVEFGKELGASPDSPLVAQLHDDVRRIEEEASRSAARQRNRPMSGRSHSTIIPPRLRAEGEALLRRGRAHPRRGRAVFPETLERAATMPHGDHEPFSRYLIDPLFTYHAILEDELRLDLFTDRRAGCAEMSWASLEVPYALTDALGAEIFVPYGRRALDGRSDPGIGDLELQPNKWSLLRSRDLVMTTALGVLVPSGNASRDPGSGRWAVEHHLFVDAVAGRLALQSNLIYGFVEGGKQELESSASAARMFFFGDVDAAGPAVELTGGYHVSF